MSLIDFAVGTIETLGLMYKKISRKSFAEWCDLQTIDDPYTFVTDDMSLVSLISIAGTTRLVGVEEFDEITERLTQALSTYLSRAYHGVQYVYVRDPDSTDRMIDDILRPAHFTAKRLNIDFTDLLNSRGENLKRFCSYESLYVCLWTTPGVLSKPEISEATKEMRKRMQTQPKLRDAQQPGRLYASLREQHASLMTSFLQDLGDISIMAEKLEAHDAMKIIRQHIDPEFTDISWRASLPGDPAPVRAPIGDTDDLSDLFWPPIRYQLVPRDAEVIDKSSYRIGDRVYSTVYIEIPPQELHPFMRLFNRVEGTIPWRISFLLEGDGLNRMGSKSMIASLVAFSSAASGAIRDAVQDLSRRQQLGETIVKLRIAATTWAPVGDTLLLRTRRATLGRALSGWGNCQVLEESGDCAQGVASTLPAFYRGSIANACAAPISEALPMLPIARPASPWETGSILYRTMDGKIWPYQPGSSLQTTWIDIVFARPGSGKSVLINIGNLATMTNAGLDSIPFISMLDIGPTSQGTVELIQESLPPHLKHYAIYQRLRMTDDYAINPMDLQLGMQKPLPFERAFIVNFLILLVTPIGQDKPYPESAELMSALVDETYLHFSQEGQARRYAKSMNREIDRLLDQLNVKIDPHTTWWEIVEDLFKAGYPHEASMAQRYAVPTISDVAALLNQSQTIEHLYGSKTIDGSDSMLVFFARQLTSAIKDYPILRQPTRFDLSDARIISLDLEEVAPKGGAQADRQTAMMYMLAAHITGKHLFLHPDDLQSVNPLYHSYHEPRIKNIRETQKRLVMDEYHRSAAAPGVRDQVGVYVREGRKRGIQVVIASQRVDDFDDTLIENATNIYIMEAGNEQTLDKINKAFRLSETELYVLRNNIRGPGPAGASFLFKFTTKAGIQSQSLMLSAGAEELWALSTTVEDNVLRRYVTAKIGAVRARRLLAKRFPSGSAKREIEKRNEAMMVKGDLQDDDTNVITKLGDEMIKDYA